MANKPVEFDPNQPFTVGGGKTVEFDPSQPFTVGEADSDVPFTDAGKPVEASTTAEESGWGLSDDTRHKLGMFGAKYGPADVAVRGIQGLQAGLEFAAHGLDSASEWMDKGTLSENSPYEPHPGSMLMALGEAFPLAGAETGLSSLGHKVPVEPLEDLGQGGRLDLQDLPGHPADEVTVGSKLEQEAEAFKNREQPVSSLEQEAAAFKGKPEPTAEDLFPTEEGLKTKQSAMEEKLQGEVDKFKESREPVGEPVFDETRPFTVAEAEAEPKPGLTPEQTSHVSSVTDKVDETKKDWTNAPGVEVVHSANDIADPSIREQAIKAGADEDALGFVGEDGKVRIIAKNIKDPSEVPAVMFHESLGHYGLAQKFGDGLQSLLHDFYDNSVGGFKEKVDQWLVDNPNDYKNAPNRHLIAAEEVLAEMSESGRINPGWMDRITNHVKSFAREMGINLKYSDREIKTILGMAHDAVVNGKGADVVSNGFRFIRASNDNRIRISDRPSYPEHGASDEEFVDYYRKSAEHYRSRAKQALEDGNEKRAARYSHQAALEERSASRRDLENPPRSSESAAHHRVNADYYEKKAKTAFDNGNAKAGKLYQEQAERARMLSSKYAEEALTSPDTRFMRRKPVEEDESPLGLPKAPHEALKALEEGYHPEVKSWAESKRAARDKGFAMSDFKKLAGVRDLSTRMFQLDNLAKKTDTKLSQLNEKLDSPNWSLRDKFDYLETVANNNLLAEHIYGNQAEIGRALNAVKAMKFTKAKIAKLNEILAEHGGSMAVLSSDDEFMRFARRVKEEMEAGNTGAAQALIRQTVKPYWWQYALTFRHAAMLSGVATHAKNIADNTLMIARELEESTMALPGSAVRGVFGLKQGVTPAEISAHMYGLLRALSDQQIFANTKKAIIEGHGNHELSSKLEMAEARIPVISKVGDVLHAQDVFYRGFMENANLYKLGVRDAQSRGLKGLAAFQEGANLARNPTAEMVKQAKDMASNTLLVDSPSMMGKAIEVAKAIRPGMTGGEQLGAAAANVVFPFFRISDRLLFQKLRRSPLSFLDRVTREDFRDGGARRDIAVARTLFGSAVIYGYWGAAKNGETEGAPESPQKTAARAAGGYLPNSVNDGDKYTDASALNISFNPFSTHNQLAADVATIYKAYKKGAESADSTANKLIIATQGMLSALASNSFAENISQYTDPFVGSGSEGSKKVAFSNLVGGVGSSFVPAIARQANDLWGDPIKRDTTGDKSPVDRIMGRVESGIPGLSNKLPPKYSVYGKEQEKGKTLLGIRSSQEIDKTPAVQELQRLEKTQDNALVTAPSPSFKVDGKSYDLKGNDYAEYQRVSGWYFIEGMKKVVEAPGWKQVDDTSKKQAVKELLRESRSAAREYLYPSQGE